MGCQSSNSTGEPKPNAPMKGAAGGFKRESCINNSLEYNAILTQRGIDPLTPDELQLFIPFWNDFVENIGNLTVEEYQKSITWAERM